jgi:hypothetical protein
MGIFVNQLLTYRKISFFLESGVIVALFLCLFLTLNSLGALKLLTTPFLSEEINVLNYKTDTTGDFSFSRSGVEIEAQQKKMKCASTGKPLNLFFHSSIEEQCKECIDVSSIKVETKLVCDKYLKFSPDFDVLHFDIEVNVENNSLYDLILFKDLIFIQNQILKEKKEKNEIDSTKDLVTDFSFFYEPEKEYFKSNVFIRKKASNTFSISHDMLIRKTESDASIGIPLAGEFEFSLIISLVPEEIPLTQLRQNVKKRKTHAKILTGTFATDSFQITIKPPKERILL